MSIDKHLRHSTGTRSHDYDQRRLDSYKRGNEASARVRRAAAEQHRRQEREQQDTVDE